MQLATLSMMLHSLMALHIVCLPQMQAQAQAVEDPFCNEIVLNHDDCCPGMDHEATSFAYWSLHHLKMPSSAARCTLCLCLHSTRATTLMSPCTQARHVTEAVHSTIASLTAQVRQLQTAVVALSAKPEPELVSI